MDTTLRDGEQNPFCTMYDNEKIEIAKMLEKLNVDIIEAGFAASKGNIEVMKEIASKIKKPYLCGLARATKQDIDATYDAFKKYDKRIVHIFVPTSDVQNDAKLKKSEDELIEMAASAVRYAAKYFQIIEFTPEDSVRSKFSTLTKMCKAVISEGAEVINIADTVGYAMPQEFGQLVKNIKQVVKQESDTVKVSAHCHNDYGMATANTYYAIQNGAGQVETTIWGIGERAGNCSLEQIIALSLRKPRTFDTQIDSTKLYEAAKLVSRATGIKSDFAPIVGKSAFSHKSGIHQHAVVNDVNSYEAVNAKDFGRKSELIMGPCSGYHGVISKAQELGYTIDKTVAANIIIKMSNMVRQKIKREFNDNDIRFMLEVIHKS
ncbi:2-isopropylmalate synthase [Candidatus Pacearchaeota archaeon]|nr:2-isopropylmalate synthase [Candidatus Pacearchaeota archaeon]